jgi:hypothetical protein
MALNPSGPVVTPGQAQVITRAAWPLREDALAANNQTATNQLEQGVAREFDDGVSADLRGRGKTGPSQRQLIDVLVAVPSQTNFPASFLAMVKTTQYPTAQTPTPPPSVVELVVFSRAQASVPWLVSLDTNATISSWPFEPAPLDGAGYDAVAPPGRESGMAVAADFATFNQRFVDQRRVPDSPDIFLPGYWTTTYMQDLVDRIAGEPARGFRSTNLYEVKPNDDGLYEFAINGEKDLACFTLRSTTRYTSLQSVLHQDPARSNWGGVLAPGTYSSITTYDLRQTCAIIPRDAGAGIGIYGGIGKTAQISGVPGIGK